MYTWAWIAHRPPPPRRRFPPPAQSMKFGIYTARGSATCLGRPGSDSHEVIDAKLWASWGVKLQDLLHRL